MAVMKIVVVGSSTKSDQSSVEFEFAQSVQEANTVLNLAPLPQRAAETMAALKAGKHVCSEAPLAASFEEARALVDFAAANELLLCAGPDTFLGASLQGVRRLLQEDVVGKPFAATAQMFCRADADWLAEASGYVTALMNFFGAVKGVSGMVAGKHRTGLLRFAGGEVATVTFSCEAYSMPNTNSIEIYAARGNMALDQLDGSIRIKIGNDDTPPADGSWGGGAWLPIDSPYDICARGIGLADMAAALRDGRKPRANAQQALHALEVLSAIEQSSAEGREIEITTPFERSPVLSLVSEF